MLFLQPSDFFSSSAEGSLGAYGMIVGAVVVVVIIEFGLNHIILWYVQFIPFCDVKNDHFFFSLSLLFDRWVFMKFL